MRYLAIIALTLYACGKQKVEVSDSEHTVTVKADLCDVFDDIKEKQDCVRKILKAIDDQEKCK